MPVAPRFLCSSFGGGIDGDVVEKFVVSKTWSGVILRVRVLGEDVTKPPPAETIETIRHAIQISAAQQRRRHGIDSGAL